ncbi:kinesin-like protein KIN-7N [Drosophila serrata]|uniref:kinesin-like protein KIN-7N n=1 Tax=Drosophila serrata TaxID=7274 RepID=UPI000A1CF878|nr:kinesin-like protein KIN-7N [Drosophila serrata]
MASMQVCIRVRPVEAGLSPAWVVKGRSIQLVDSTGDRNTFDSVFDEGAGNLEVFNRMCKHILRACVHGINGTIFTYGQKLSGKTYTMMGDAKNCGIMEMAVRELFQQISLTADYDIVVHASYFEIFNEKVNDLFNEKNQDLEIIEGHNGMVWVNCEDFIISNENELMELVCQGNMLRNGNSHAILRVITEWKCDLSNTYLQSVLDFVDLSGTERLSGDSPIASRATGGVYIDKSLMCLSNVIKKLSFNYPETNINFGECKLTRFLQASLCGNAYISIIGTIKASSIVESQSTMKIVMLAKMIRVHPQVNTIDPLMIQRHDTEIYDDELGDVTCQPFQIMRRCGSCPVTMSGTDAEPEISKAIIPEFSRLPRPSKMPELQEFYMDIAPQRDLPTRVSQVTSQQPSQSFEEKAVNTSKPGSQKDIFEEFDKLTKFIHDLDLHVRTGFSSLYEDYPKQMQTIPPTEYVEQIEKELESKVKMHSDEIIALELKYTGIIEAMKNEKPKKFQAHKLELEDTRKKLLRSATELSTVTSCFKDELLRFKDAFTLLNQRRVDEEIAKHQNAFRENLLQAEENMNRMQIAHSEEMEQMRAELQEQIQKAEDDLEMMKEQNESLQREYDLMRTYLNTLVEQKSSLEIIVQELQETAKKSDSHEELKLSFSEVNKEFITVQERVITLESQLKDSQEETSNRDEEIQKLRSDLKHVLDANDTANGELSNVTAKLEAAEDKMCEKEIQHEEKIADFNEFINTLKDKIRAQKTSNNSLKLKLKNQAEAEHVATTNLQIQLSEQQENIIQLEQQLMDQELENNQKLMKMSQDAASDRKEIDDLINECNQLDAKTVGIEREKNLLNLNISSLTKETESQAEEIKSLYQDNKRKAELIAQLKGNEKDFASMQDALTNQKMVAETAYNECQKLKEQNEKLEKSMKSKVADMLSEKERMARTIYSLLEDKRNLEEKQCNLEEKAQKMIQEISALKSSSPNSAHPLSPINLSFLSVDDEAEPIKKSSKLKIEVRKQQRKAAYDKHRMGLGDYDGSTDEDQNDGSHGEARDERGA